MAGERLLIVEDERIVAEDLHDMLERLKYHVVGIASSGEDAVQMCEQTQPDLVLMDIRLNGELDGIQAAETIGARYEIPITYLTAYADENTLERAKATLPFGYILKPFEERDLRTTIEIALYKHQMESTLKEMQGWHACALESLTDAVIATNSQGFITFMNPAAEALTGWQLRQVYGKTFKESIQVLSESGPALLDHAVEFAQKPMPLGNPQQRPTGVLKTHDGQSIRIEYGINPLKHRDGSLMGNIVELHPALSHKEPQRAV